MGDVIGSTLIHISDLPVPILIPISIPIHQNGVKITWYTTVGFLKCYE